MKQNVKQIGLGILMAISMAAAGVAVSSLIVENSAMAEEGGGDE